ncbi:MAG: 3-deoxy-D-manno-octulosonic acid transferase, partial [Candidatus Omnitrophica bacterium CG07_land_8_20_14_0_80_50_8]
AAEPVSASDRVLLLDTMGVLAGLYRLADVVFVGGSLVPYGGHNLVEPAYFEKPLLFGPWMANFKEMAFEFKKAQGALEVKDAGDLEIEIRRFIREAERGKAMGAAAKKVIACQRGATKRNSDAFLNAVHF